MCLGRKFLLRIFHICCTCSVRLTSKVSSWGFSPEHEEKEHLVIIPGMERLVERMVERQREKTSLSASISLKV